MTTVVVEADRDRARLLAAFEARRHHGGAGHFVTRDDIEKRHPASLSDILRTVPGIVVTGREVGRTGVRFTRSTCAPQFFVDGLPIESFRTDDMPPSDVEGIELYSSAAGVPAEYNRLRATNCGTILIWSRLPGVPADPPRKP